LTNDHRSRSVARVARTEDPPTPAQEVARLLAELHDAVETREKVPRYRAVRRSRDREILVLDWAVHHTREPGLLAQLGTVAHQTDQAPVDVYRWVRDPDDPCRRDYDDERDNRQCPHGRRVYVRTEQRPIPGVVTAGAAVHSGSPGWDADGALAPLTGRSKPDAAEPISDAWHVGQEITTDLDNLAAELAAEGHQGTLVDVALADEETGRRIASRLRAFVARARVAAGYDAPVVTLRDRYCPMCSGPLRVRADASSAVWCGGMLAVHGPPTADDPDRVPLAWAPCGARWPRGGWVALLDEIDQASPVQPSRDDLSAAEPPRVELPAVDATPSVLAGLVHQPTEIERPTR
jgi:hypothetical protein